MSYFKPHSYPVDTIVLRGNGTEILKTKEGWVPRSRVVAALSNKVIGGGHDLDDNERVFHLDCTTKGQKGHNDPDNLVVIKINKENVRFIKTKSRVLFMPKTGDVLARR